MNVPIAVLGIVGALLLVPPSKAEKMDAIDYVGGLLSIISVGSLVYATIEGPRFGWGAVPITAAGVFPLTLVESSSTYTDFLAPLPLLGFAIGLSLSPAADTSWLYSRNFGCEHGRRPQCSLSDDAGGLRYAMAPDAGPNSGGSGPRQDSTPAAPHLMTAETTHRALTAGIPAVSAWDLSPLRAQQAADSAKDCIPQPDDANQKQARADLLDKAFPVVSRDDVRPGSRGAELRRALERALE